MLQSLFLAAIGEAKDKGAAALETFAYRYPEGESDYERFLVEFIRTSPRQALDLTAPQWVLLPIMALLVIHFGRQARRGAWRVPIAPRPMEALT